MMQKHYCVFYKSFLLKVVRTFLKLFLNCYLVEFFPRTFSRAEGWLVCPNQRVLALPQPKGGLRWQNLMKIAGNCWKLLKMCENCGKLVKISGNCWKLMKICGNCWKLMKIVRDCWKFMKIDENLDEKFSRPKSCSKFSNRFFELFPPGKFY